MGYNRSVRRLLAITLAILFGLPVVAPLFALGSSAESSLPICCRKDGTHHCTLHLTSAAPQGTAFRNSQPPCPAYPATVVPIRQIQIFLQTAYQLSIQNTVDLAARSQTVSPLRFLLDRSRQERGPPSVIA